MKQNSTSRHKSFFFVQFLVGFHGYHHKDLLSFSSEEKAKLEIVPVFISVDPERDTVEQVHDYVKGMQFLAVVGCSFCHIR